MALSADTTTPWWLLLLDEQRRLAFADLAGARTDVVLPISDTLLTRVLRERLPSQWPIRELAVRALGQDAFAVRVRLTRPSFLPAITVRLVVEQQPSFPESPILVLRLVREGVAALAAPALRFFDALPPGLRFEGDRLLIDLRALATRYGVQQWLPFVRGLRVTSDPGRMVVAVQAALPSPEEQRS